MKYHKLDEEDVKNIVFKYQNGALNADLAREYNVGHATIAYHIKKSLGLTSVGRKSPRSEFEFATDVWNKFQNAREEIKKIALLVGELDTERKDLHRKLSSVDAKLAQYRSQLKKTVNKLKC